MMSEKYLLNEITYSFIASYMWGVGGGKPNYDTVCQRGGGVQKMPK